MIIIHHSSIVMMATCEMMIVVWNINISPSALARQVGWSHGDLAYRAGRGSRERQFCSSGAELSQPDLSRLCLQEEVVTQIQGQTHHGQEEGIYDPRA